VTAVRSGPSRRISAPACLATVFAHITGQSRVRKPLRSRAILVSFDNASNYWRDLNAV